MNRTTPGSPGGHALAWEPERTFDALRATEYARLDIAGHVYLDYTGGGLHAASQLRQHHAELETEVFGNPHSNNPTSQATTDRVARARAYVLEYFRAPADEYLVIFTSNASGALRQVGEAYPFDSGSRYLLTFDNHNSVNGIREFARRAGAATTYLPLTRTDLRLDRGAVARALAAPAAGVANLFAYPAQSNYSGVQHPLELIDEAHAAGWDVLLDAAAFVPTNRLDLGRWKPDMVVLSFYKMFGYPTGLGALLMRRDMAARMRRPWFAGGTIRIASVQGEGFYRAADEAAFEDGTVDYLNIPAVEIGLRYLAGVGIDAVHDHVTALTGRMLDGMRALQHAGGAPMVRLHGPDTADARGGTVAFNVLAPDGHPYDIRRVEELAIGQRISLRTGCFCNPGANEATYGLSAAQIGAFFNRSQSMSFDELRLGLRDAYGVEIGAIRASVGIATNGADIQRFLGFLGGFRDRTVADVGAGPVRSTCGAEARDSA
ncbi:MAG: aminotransferase class V-fold PLP-dependent enzyme [Vicinamibacterales bacterium]